MESPCRNRRNVFPAKQCAILNDIFSLVRNECRPPSSIPWILFQKRDLVAMAQHQPIEERKSPKFFQKRIHASCLAIIRHIFKRIRFLHHNPFLILAKSVVIHAVGVISKCNFDDPRQAGKTDSLRNPNAPMKSAQYAESAPRPSTTSGHGPPFLIIAGIHESVAIQKRNPFMNAKRKLFFGECVLAYHMRSASAKKTSMLSPTGGNEPHRRNAGRNRARCRSFLNIFVIMARPSFRPRGRSRPRRAGRTASARARP